MEVARLPPQARLTRGAIVEKTLAPTSAMAQVLAALVHAGILVAQPGPHGGYRLARPAAKISLLDVVGAIDTGNGPQECAVHGRPCGLMGDYCVFHWLLVDAQRRFLEALGKTSVDDVLRAEKEREASRAAGLPPMSAPSEEEATPESDDLSSVPDTFFYALARNY